MTSPTMKSALLYKRRTSRLTVGDQEHIERWLYEADDPIWEKIAADIRTHDRWLSKMLEGPYSVFLGAALRARQFAESAEKPALQRKLKQRQAAQKRADMLALAGKMIEVGRLYRDTARHNLEGAPAPPDHPQPDRQRNAQKSLEWLEQTAQKLCQLAEKSSDDDLGHFEGIVSRQSTGKKRKAQSRELSAFCQLMVRDMISFCGKPRYSAVATMTNIAFPAEPIGEDDVRSFCKPTTREGRRRKTGALNR